MPASAKSLSPDAPRARRRRAAVVVADAADAAAPPTPAKAPKKSNVLKAAVTLSCVAAVASFRP